MSVVPPHCQPLNSTMCKNLNYIYVEVPNFWGDNTQEEAEARIQAFSPLVNSGCSPSLRVFLCLLYFPPCVVNFRKMIPPCRELCEEARRGCKPALEGAGFPWPGIMKCSQFPYYDKNGSNVCLKPETKTTKGKESLFLLLSSLLLLLLLLLSLSSQFLLLFFLCISRAQTMHLERQSHKSIILFIH